MKDCLKTYYKIKDFLGYWLIYTPKDILKRVNDYERLAYDYSRVICHATSSKMSYTTYDVNTVCSEIDSAYEKSVGGMIADDVSYIVESGGSIPNILEYLKNYKD